MKSLYHLLIAIACCGLAAGQTRNVGTQGQGIQTEDIAAWFAKLGLGTAATLAASALQPINRTTAQGSPVDAVVRVSGAGTSLANGDYYAAPAAANQPAWSKDGLNSYPQIVYTAGVFSWTIEGASSIYYSNASGTTLADVVWQTDDGGTGPPPTIVVLDLPAEAIGQWCRVGDASPFAWYQATSLTSWVYRFTDGQLLSAFQLATEADTARTLALEDAGGYIRLTAVGAITITVPENSTVPFAIGTEIFFRRTSAAGAITVTPSGAVVINGNSTTTPPNGTFTLKKVGPDEWDFI